MAASSLSSTCGLAPRTVFATCGRVLRLRTFLGHIAKCARTGLGCGELSGSSPLGLFSILGTSVRASHDSTLAAAG